MKILFVASGNSKNFELLPFIKTQGESLREKGIEVEYFPVIGKGGIGYLKSSRNLHLYLKKNSVDLIHAHYTLCGWVAVLAFPKAPIVLSIMGDDAYGCYYDVNKVKFISRYLTILTFLIQPFLKGIISKSRNISKYVYLKKKAHIIPNGVNIEKLFNKDNSRAELELEISKQYVLFLGDPLDRRKNISLVKNAMQLLKNSNIELIAPYPIPHELVLKYLKTVDIFVLTAFIEGSPNVIKEAMACNCPIVSTDVGDVKWVLGETEGCFISSFEPKDFADKIKRALHFAEIKCRTNGRQRIFELGLDSETIATRIINVYNKVLN